MRFTIIGAGAIGSIVGVHLAHAGHDVAFIEANPDHAAAIRANGLRLSGAADAVLHAPVALPEEAAGPLTHVLLAVKARHTLQALETVVPLLASDGYVVSLQNGLEEYRIADRVGAGRTIGAFLTFGGHYRAPGEVVYGGPGSFRIGELDGVTTPRLLALRDALSSVQTVETTPNIFGFLWAKMALGAIYFATALVSADVVDIYAHAQYRDVLGALAGEVVGVARTEGVTVEAFDGFDPNAFRLDAPGSESEIAASWDGQRRYWGRHAGGRTGVWRDFAQHRRPTEVGEQVEPVTKIAARHGIAVPRLDALVRLIRSVEAGAPLGWQNLDEILAVHIRSRGNLHR